MIQKPISSPLSGKAPLSTPAENEASRVKNQEHFGDLFDYEDAVHQVLVPPGQIVNQHHYREVLCLREQVCQKHLE
jgi:hypothetical protein